MVGRSEPRGVRSHKSLKSRLIRHWMLVGVVLVGAVVGGIIVTDSVSDVQELADDSKELAGNATDEIPSNESLNATKTERLIHVKINEERSERGLSQLDHNPELRSIASEYSKSMATEGFYGHTSPSGETFEDRYQDAGFSCRVKISETRYATGAENILYTFAYTNVRDNGETERYQSEEEVADAAVEDWMQSEGHRENILREYWDTEGIGVYVTENPEGPGKKVFVTQNFC